MAGSGRFGTDQDSSNCGDRYDSNRAAGNFDYGSHCVWRHAFVAEHMQRSLSPSRPRKHSSKYAGHDVN